jgi:Rieske Fe-S protein
MEEKDLTRRSMLRMGWLALLGAVGLSLGPATEFLEAAPGAMDKVLTGGKPGDYPGPGPYPVENGRAWLVRDEGGLAAIIPVCSHLGCGVRWDKEASQWVCPCHNSKYSPDGKPLQGPAQRPLSRAMVTIDASGRVKVDLRREVGPGYRLEV